ncbi:MAG: hypothetical protein A3E84_05875 [Gammaproteobacteria bacterium RIFCSPHIGHO2_12_FULL_42_13]|nr:MAG: hypothetical protein A3E84_05875 [Gammaproteobacteria bacterium RIFCSPHIGHO2_12_FULL_42_13]
MIRHVFLDANILFSAAYRENAGLTRLWKLKNTRLVSSYYAITEAERNLSASHQLQRLKTLINSLEVITNYNDSLIPSNIKLNAKDRPILAAAISAKASFLMTGDRDFEHLFGEKIMGVKIVTPSMYFSEQL